MAKLKKSSRKTKSSPATSSELQAKAEQLSRSFAESAQQIWLAGAGAFQRAQLEGSKLFDTLVKEGSGFENSTRKLATVRVDAVRDAVEGSVGSVRERAVDTWDRLENVFEERVQRALTRLGVPGREDLAELSARVDALTRALKQRQTAAATKAAKAAKAPKPVKAPSAVKKVAKKKPEMASKPKTSSGVKTAKKALKPVKARQSALAPIATPEVPQG